MAADKKEHSLVNVHPSGFVGCNMDNGLPQISLPKVFTEHLESIRNDSRLALKYVLLTLNILKKYFYTIQQSLEEENEKSNIINGDLGLIDSISSAFELYNDYKTNGLYLKRKSQAVKFNRYRRIDWQRTINTKHGILIDGTPIYINHVEKANFIDHDNPLRKLHIATIAKISQLFCLNVFPPYSPINSLELDLENASAVKSLIQESRTRTFDDRGLWLLYTILKFLQCAPSITKWTLKSKTDFLCGVNSFEFVWESILRTKFENDRGKALRKLPRGEWVDDKGLTNNGILPRIDFAWAGSLGRKNNILIIADAKDKLISPEGKYCGSEQDYYKQLIYRLLLQAEGIECVGNVLIFPVVDAERGMQSIFKYLGFHRWENMNNSIVHAFSADFLSLSAWYLGSRKYNINKELEFLINNIFVS